MGLTVTLIEGPEELRGITIPADHLDACDTQCIPTSGNAAGNVGTDLTGAYTLPPNPDNGSVPSHFTSVPSLESQRYAAN